MAAEDYLDDSGALGMPDPDEDGSRVQRIPAGPVWSAYQENVFAAVEAAAGNVVVEALAGSGKTTTMCEAMARTKESTTALAVAFNKVIAGELASRVPQGVEVRTMHAFGMRALAAAVGRVDVDNDLTFTAVSARLGRSRETLPLRRAVCALVSAAKHVVTAPEQIDALDCEALADRFGIDVPADKLVLAESLTQKVLTETVQRAGTAGIGFDDMVWLPVVLGLDVPTYDWVFVDEAQDLDPVQIELLTRVAVGGRLVAVGDRHQAIYGWRGADPQAIPRLIGEFNATVCPLPVTYRCPLAVVREAQRHVPKLQPAPGAAQGKVMHTTTAELAATAAPGDFVLSRTNAPLLALALRWIAAGKRCRIQGRDIGQGLTQWIKGTGARSVSELQACTAAWLQAEVERLEAKGRDTAAAFDRAECIDALCNGAGSVTAVLERIARVFSDSGGGCVVLSSVHRAKGLEAQRVWLLRDTFMRRSLQGKCPETGRKLWGPPSQEEFNLFYVAVTRSQNELLYAVEEKA